MNVACKTCGADDDFATLETIEGAALITVSVDEQGKIAYDFVGETKVYWDSSTTYGYICRNCGTQAERLGELVNVNR